MEENSNINSSVESSETGEVTDVYRRLRSVSKFTAIMTFFSVIALVLLFLALSDISKGGEDTKLEWVVAGLSFIILAVYVISVIITLIFITALPGFFSSKSRKKSQ
ncbi:MAG: hypothetical protein GYA43_10945 [Bacteroidales bacterium]|nr:hypothetical protein [Bacteroidales bacterium]